MQRGAAARMRAQHCRAGIVPAPGNVAARHGARGRRAALHEMASSARNEAVGGVRARALAVRGALDELAAPRREDGWSAALQRFAVLTREHTRLAAEAGGALDHLVAYPTHTRTAAVAALGGDAAVVLP